MRLIAVVLGAENKQARTLDITSMLDYGFANFALHTFVKAGAPLGLISVYKGMQTSVPVVTPRSYSLLLPTTMKNRQFSHRIELHKQVAAPLKSGQPIGTISLFVNEKKIAAYAIPAPRSVERAGFWTLAKRTFAKLLFVES
jgi:D-alanyl-D-alanine carboxypeptidase (penicillin-binding protein 5/6)